MKELLSQLKKEVSHLTSKSLGPIGFDYRRRTKVERILFLIAKEYCKDKFGYGLGGLGYSHKRMFSEYVDSRSSSLRDAEVVKEAFKISELISELTSSDPYAREDAMEELGGTIYAIFRNLGNRIMRFVDNVSSCYSEG